MGGESNNGLCCIDFGTSTTAASVMVDGEPRLVRHGNNRCFPSAACVLENGEIEVCDNALALRTKFPASFKSEFKLNIAEPLDISGHGYADLVAAILKFVKRCAEIESNGVPVDRVVLTVPAMYTAEDARLDVMRRAAGTAGFETVDFLSEPIAAARHYAHVSGAASDGLTLIYDLGGGTFDPALVRCSDDGSAEVIGSAPGEKCGGRYFDKAIYSCLCDRYKATDTPLTKSGRLDDYATCRRMKEALSASDEVTQLLSNGQMARLTRKEFEQLVAPLVEMTLASCDAMLKNAGCRWKDVSRVLFVGGSSAIPLISMMLETHLVSHNASAVKLVRNFKGENGSYDYRYATALGGIAPKITVKADEPPVVVESVTLCCLVCGYEPGEDDCFCSNCGHRLGLEPLTCKSCNALLPVSEEMKYCIYCGKPLTY